MSRGILVVDDQPQVVKALWRLFQETEYRIYTAQSGREGLELLEQHCIDLVLSDMRMPEMDGYEFLLAVKERYPHVKRLLLSGYADEKVVSRALQQGVAELYLFKPWCNQGLLDTVGQLL